MRKISYRLPENPSFRSEKIRDIFTTYDSAHWDDMFFSLLAPEDAAKHEIIDAQVGVSNGGAFGRETSIEGCNDPEDIRAGLSGERYFKEIQSDQPPYAPEVEVSMKYVINLMGKAKGYEGRASAHRRRNHFRSPLTENIDVINEPHLRIVELKWDEKYGEMRNLSRFINNLDLPLLEGRSQIKARL